ncbi:putative microtubule binding protein [Anopheles sinensis]|uniref:Microtubule-associated protein n=1 Tax=Anopheles sinensis TaxID=74873 RepID=A0A084VFY8_ANOSI|nr:putative microtubule binding protein [Anopheles sinensis]
MRPTLYNRPMGDGSRPTSGTPDGSTGGGGLPSATHSIDDDEDVVIGKLPMDGGQSALNSPNPARGPPRSFNMPPGSGIGDREKSIPSRPPSVAGSYAAEGTNEPQGNRVPLHALKDFINKDPSSRQPSASSPGQTPGSQQLSPANTDDNFTAGYQRPGGPGKPILPPQQPYKMGPPGPPQAGGPSPTAGDKVTFQIPNGTQEWTGRSRPPQQQMGRTMPSSAMKLTADHKGDNDSGVDEYTQEKSKRARHTREVYVVAGEVKTQTSDRRQTLAEETITYNVASRERVCRRPMLKIMMLGVVQTATTTTIRLFVEPFRKFMPMPARDNGTHRHRYRTIFTQARANGTAKGHNAGEAAPQTPRLTSSVSSVPPKWAIDFSTGLSADTHRWFDRPNALASPASPLKSPSKIPGLARRPENISSESRSRSTSKQRANAKTPETPSEPQPLIKKVPMNKIQVGGVPSPNLKVVKSKIGSLENASHKPGGGNVKIETKKIEVKAAPRIEAKNETYVPKGGDKKIVSTKLQWNAKPKIGSLENAAHKPGGGDKRIESIKTDFKERAKPKIGSKDNITYKPGGGDVKIVTQKLDIKAESKIGSLDNLKHKPGGGDKKIFDDKEYLKQIEHPITPSPSTQVKSGAGSLENLLE